MKIKHIVAWNKLIMRRPQCQKMLGGMFYGSKRKRKLRKQWLKNAEDDLKRMFSKETGER